MTQIATHLSVWANPVLNPKLDTIQIRIHGGAQDGRAVIVDATQCLIGSDPNCSLRLTDFGIRPFHCQITQHAQGPLLRCCSPQTLVNGKPFATAWLRRGDRIQLAAIELEIGEFLSRRSIPSRDSVDSTTVLPDWEPESTRPQPQAAQLTSHSHSFRRAFHVAQRLATQQIAPEQIAPEQIAPEQIAPEQIAPEQMKAPESAAPTAEIDRLEEDLCEEVRFEEECLEEGAVAELERSPRETARQAVREQVREQFEHESNLSRELEEAQRCLATAEQLRGETERERETLRGEMRQLLTQLQELQAYAEELRSQLRDTRDLLQQEQRQSQEARTELQAASATIEECRQSIAQLRQDAAEVQSQLRSQNADLHAQMTAAQEAKRQLEAELADKARQLDECRQMLDASRLRLGETEARLEDVRVLESQVSAEREAKRVLEAQMETHLQQLMELNRALHNAQVEGTQALNQWLDERQHLTGVLEHEQASRCASEQRLAEFEAELARQRQELDTMRVEQERLLVEQNSIAVERDAIAVERDAILAERNAILAERDAMAAAQTVAQSSQTELELERADRRRERELLVQQLIAARDAIRQISLARTASTASETTPVPSEAPAVTRDETCHAREPQSPVPPAEYEPPAEPLISEPHPSEVQNLPSASELVRTLFTSELDACPEYRADESCGHPQSLQAEPTDPAAGVKPVDDQPVDECPTADQPTAEWPIGEETVDEESADDISVDGGSKADRDAGLSSGLSSVELMSRMSLLGSLSEALSEETLSGETPSAESNLRNVAVHAHSPEEPRIESSPSEDEEDDSIRQYMDRLLNRIRTETVGEPVPAPAAPPKPTLPKTVSLSSEPVPLKDVDPANDEEEEFIPRSRAPEMPVDLAAMRQLANESATTAIATSQKNTRERRFRGNVQLSAVMLVVSIIMLYAARDDAWVLSGGIVLCISSATPVILQFLKGQRRSKPKA